MFLLHFHLCRSVWSMRKINNPSLIWNGINFLLVSVISSISKKWLLSTVLQTYSIPQSTCTSNALRQCLAAMAAMVPLMSSAFGRNILSRAITSCHQELCDNDNENDYCTGRVVEQKEAISCMCSNNDICNSICHQSFCTSVKPDWTFLANMWQNVCQTSLFSPCTARYCHIAFFVPPPPTFCLLSTKALALSQLWLFSINF